MTETIEVTQQNTSQEVDNNLLIPTHIVYAINIFLSFWGFFLAIILYFINKNTISRSHLKFIIKTNIIYLVAFIVPIILLGFGSLNLIGQTAFMANFIPTSMTATIIATQGVGLAILIIGIALGLIVWYYLRMIGGWITLIRKEPIKGHFGIRFSKK